MRPKVWISPLLLTAATQNLWLVFQVTSSKKLVELTRVINDAWPASVIWFPLGSGLPLASTFVLCLISYSLIFVLPTTGTAQDNLSWLFSYW